MICRVKYYFKASDDAYVYVYRQPNEEYLSFELIESGFKADETAVFDFVLGTPPDRVHELMDSMVDFKNRYQAELGFVPKHILLKVCVVTSSIFDLE